MTGDFSRDTFEPRKHFLRVLMQQGRVLLDADWNEQTAIVLHYLQSLAKDIIGDHGGPKNQFEIFDAKIEENKINFKIRKGHYYVDGILCNNEGDVLYTEQPDWPGAAKLAKDQTYYLVFLDVWERHLTAFEEWDIGNRASIRERALSGPDTATRSKVLWQVKTTLELPDRDSTNPNSFLPITDKPTKQDVINKWGAWQEKWQPANRGQLKAQAVQQPNSDKDSCTILPEVRFRGAENQLYRIEIHTSPIFDYGYDDQKKFYVKEIKEKATFKWSRDNGAVVFPITSIELSTEDNEDRTIVTLAHLGRDDRFGLTAGENADWVEILDDDYVLQGGIESQQTIESLFKVIEIDRLNLKVKLAGKANPNIGNNLDKHPLLRRWDHKQDKTEDGWPEMDDNGVLILVEGKWLNLEDGVQIMFEPGPADPQDPKKFIPPQYRRGDYWLVPARTATGDIEWPRQKEQNKLVPLPLPPQGAEHHFAPLAIIKGQDVTNCRREIASVAT